jgi:DNA-binding response OmpR family regulator
MAHVLVVEDEGDVRELLTLHLKREGYTVSAFEDAESAIANLAKEKFDLAILDWMLPKMSGLDLCKHMRASDQAHVPILLLTARADTMDKVLGLEIGADDYLTKPFEIREFVARVRALLRRASQAPATSEQNTGPLKLNLASKKIFDGEQELSLTPNEFKLLATLMQKPGVTFERTELIKLIQGPGVAVVDRTIDTTVLGLRKKLGDKADYVETVRGFGYRFKAGE